MPPRKSVGRQIGATPARSTKFSSSISVISNESPQTRRSARQAARGGSQASGDSSAKIAIPSASKGPLPDLQNQQSYAYGATKGPKLPNALETAGKRSLQDMAGHIEEDFEEEEVDEQEPESDSDEASNLSENQEESDREDGRPNERDEDQSSEISQPSQFPSGLMDHSYNYERGIRRIRTVNIRTHTPQPFTPIKKISESTRDNVSRLAAMISKAYEQTKSFVVAEASALYHITVRMFNTLLRQITVLPWRTIFALMALLLAVLLGLGMVGATVCFLYERIGCNVIPVTGVGGHIHTGLRSICGECSGVPIATTFNLTTSNPEDLSRLSATLTNINKKIQDLERRLTYRMDSSNAALESDLSNLKQQQIALSNHLADHVDHASGSTGNVASPLMNKINFFSPFNGVIIDPLRSSPTKEIKGNMAVEFGKKLVWMNTHYAKPPVTALIPWQDYGDCWCAADQRSNATGQDLIRLAISTKEMIYPSELILEHFPSAGNLDRAATPRKIELWADFSHLDDDAWKQLKLDDMQTGNVLGPNFARVGKMKYDIAGRTSHIQTSALEVNQFGLLHYAQHFVLRVTANYGGKNACLYRVRLHGQPVAAPEVGNTEEWLERMGYEAELE